MVALANAYVRIRPETSGFRAEATAKLRALNISANVRLQPDVSGFQTAVRAMLARNPITANVKVDTDVSRIGPAIRQGVSSAGGEREASKKGTSIAAAFSKGFEGGGSTFGRVAATMAARTAIATAAVSALTPAIVNFGAAVAPAAGVAAALPAVLGAMQVTSLATKVAVIGVGDAITAGFGDSASKAAKALQGLHGEARTFASAIIALRPQLTGIQQETANGLFRPINNEIRPLAQTYLPLLRAQLPQTSAGVGALAAEFANAARQAPAVRGVNAVFDQTQVALQRVLVAVRPVVNALGNGLAATAPVISQLAGYLANAAVKAAAFVNEAAKTGQLMGWIQNGINTIKLLGQIFINVGAIMRSVFQSVIGDSGNLLVKIRDLTVQARAWVESAQGARTLAATFQTLGVFGEALRRSLAGVFPQIGESLRIAAPVAAQFAQALSRMIVAVAPLLPALTGVTAALIRGLIPAMTAFAGWLSRNQGLVQALAPLLVAYAVAARAVSVATGVATIATRVWSVAVGVAKAAQAGWTAVMWLANAPVNVNTLAMRASQSTIATWIGVKALEARAWLSSIGATVRDTAAKVANRVATVAHAVAARASAAATAAMAAVQNGAALAWVRTTAATVAGTAAQIGARIATIAGTVATGAATIATTALGVAWRFLTGPLGIAITVIGLVSAAIVYLWKNNETFRRIVLAVWAAVRTAISAVGSWFTGTLVPLLKRGVDLVVAYYRFWWEVSKAVALGILAAIRGFLNWWNGTAVTGIKRGVDFVIGYYRFWWDVSKAVALGILAAIRGFLNWWTGTAVPGVKRGVDNVVSFFRNLLATGRTLWNQLMSAINTVRAWIAGVLVNSIRAAINTITSVFRTYQAAARTIWNAVQSAINAVRAWIAGTLVNNIRSAINTITSVFRTFSTTARTLWNAMQASINTVRGWIAGTLVTSIRSAITIITTVFRTFASVGRTLWNTLSAGILAAWNSIRSGSFTPLRNFITQTLPAAFRTGVGAIRAAWATVQAAARTPVAFVVNRVINPLIGGWNTIARVFHAPTAKTIGGFEAGGRIPGRASARDNMLATMTDAGGNAIAPLKVATGEFIVNSASTAKWLPVLEAINDEGRRARPPTGVDPMRDGLAGFADGGLIGWAKGLLGKAAKATSRIFAAVADPSGTLKKLADAAISTIPGGGYLRTGLVNAGRQLTNAVIDKMKGLFVADTSGGGGGAAGIGGNASPGFPPWPRSPGAQRGNSGVWRKVVALIRSTGPLSGAFGNAYRPGDPKWHGSGRAVDWMGFNQDALATFLARRNPLELIHRTNRRDYAYTRGRNKGSFNSSLMQAHRNHIHIAMRLGGLVDKLTGSSPVKLMDSGGNLGHGEMALNRSGYTEHVLTGGPTGDVAEMKEILLAILSAIQASPDRYADALGSNTRRAVQLGRSRGVTVVGGATA